MLTVSPPPGGRRAAAGPGAARRSSTSRTCRVGSGANIDVYEAPNTTFGASTSTRRSSTRTSTRSSARAGGSARRPCSKASPGSQQAENLVFQQAAAQGQTVFSAAGDEGSNDCNAFRTTAPVSPILSVDDPSGQPYVVAAGGTTMDDATQPASEHVWNDGAAWGAGGGGISESWPMPAWQLDSQVPGVGDAARSATRTPRGHRHGQPGYASAVRQPAGSDEGACREVPDVSAKADEFTGADHQSTSPSSAAG